RFCLRNRSDRTIRAYSSDLPWGSTHSLTTAVVPLGSGEPPLHPELFIDDPPTGEITIPPGGAATGTVDLQKLFPSLPGRLVTESMVLFWSYRLEPIGSVPLSREGGWLLLEHKPPPREESAERGQKGRG